MKWLKYIAIAVVLLILGFGFMLYSQMSGIKSEKLTDDVHVIFGMGGNVAVLKTSEGAVIVDTMSFQMQGEAIAEEAKRLTGQPVVMVINTHYHGDHTHGNPGFDPASRLVSTARTLEHLKKRDGDFWREDNAPFLPNETFTGDKEIQLGGKTIRLLAPGRGHTDGDLVALFVEDRVIHTGNLYFNELYPNIDLEAGGTVQLWGATLDRVLELEFDKVIPGHGVVTGRAGMKQFQSFINQLAELGRDAAARKETLETFVASAALTADAGYEPIEIPFVVTFDRPFVLRRSWEEATGTVKPD